MIQRIFFFCVVVMLSVSISNDSQSQTTIGARSISLGQAGTALANDVWGIFSNPALLTTSHPHLSFYGFRYVGLAEITDMAASASLPTRIGTLATGFHRYGFDLFNRTQLRFGYKYRLDRFHAGASFNYSHVQFGGGYGSAGAAGLNIGLAAQLSDKLWLGARATNINQPSYGDTEEYLPRDLSVGLSFLPSDGVTLLLDTVKDVRFPVSVRAGAEIMLIDGLYGRAGITTQPQTYSGGFGYTARSWQVNIGIQQHVPLGLSPAVDMSVMF